MVFLELKVLLLIAVHDAKGLVTIAVRSILIRVWGFAAFGLDARVVFVGVKGVSFGNSYRLAREILVRGRGGKVRLHSVGGVRRGNNCQRCYGGTDGVDPFFLFLVAFSGVFFGDHWTCYSKTNTRYY